MEFPLVRATSMYCSYTESLFFVCYHKQVDAKYFQGDLGTPPENRVNLMAFKPMTEVEVAS